MARDQRERVLREIVERLSTWREGDGDLAGLALSEVHKLFRADHSFSYRVETGESGASLMDLQTAGVAMDVSEMFGSFIRKTPQWGHYDPSNVEREQRNVVRTLAELRRRYRREAPILTQSRLSKRLEIARKDQLRVLLCDGGRMLRWFGCFRETAFSHAERRQLRGLVAPLRARLLADEQLRLQRLKAAAFDTAMEAVGAATYLVDTEGRIEHANAAGAHRLSFDGTRVRDELRLALAAGVPGLRLLRVECAGIPARTLVIEHATEASPAARVALAAERWALTPRQTQVLELVALGQTNKTVAAHLGCAEATVEIHVSALLNKAGADSRAQVVAKFWTLA